MNISKSSWHYRLFFHSYVSDRRWLDSGKTGFSSSEEREELRKLFPEAEEYFAFLENFQGSNGDLAFGEGSKKEMELSMPYRKVRDIWRREKETVYTATKTREVGEQLSGGSMSLCPYFWAVMYALFYRGFTRGWRAVEIMTAVVVAVIFAILITSLSYVITYNAYKMSPTSDQIITGFYTVVEKIPTKDDIVVGVGDVVDKIPTLDQATASIASQYREMTKQEANFQEVSSPSWRLFKRGTSDGEVVLAFVGGFFIMVILFLTAVLFAFLWEKVILVLWRKTRYFLREKAVVLWRKIVSSESADVVRDTSVLLFAFIKAKKERVCPLITLEEGEGSK